MGNFIERNKGLVFGIMTILTTLGSFVFYTNQPDPPPLAITPIEATPTVTIAIAEAVITDTPTPQPTNTPQPLRVYVTGQVNRPDVYYLPPGSIIKDAIALAGGPTDTADLTIVNLAQELQDQQQITLPAKSETLPTPPVVVGGVANPAPATNGSQSAGSQPLIAGQKINLNTATLDDLTQLSGIGPAIAQRIIDYRTSNGHFSVIEDLVNVKGIGSATFEKVKDSVTIVGN